MESLQEKMSRLKKESDKAQQVRREKKEGYEPPKESLEEKIARLKSDVNTKGADTNKEGYEVHQETMEEKLARLKSG